MATINSRGPTKPDDLAFDQGNCTHEQDAHRQSHRGISDAAVCRYAASGRRLRLASVGDSHRKLGPWLTVFTGRDSALNGQVGTINQMTGQRANQISDDVYGPKTRSTSNPAAFAQPAPGTFGNHVRASIAGLDNG